MGQIANTASGRVPSRFVVISTSSPAAIDGLEHAKSRPAPVENGMLDGPEHVKGKERNEEVARDVVYPFHDLVHVPAHSHR